MNSSRLKDQPLRDAAGARGRVVDIRGDEAVVALEQGGTVRVPLTSLREEAGGYSAALTFSDLRAGGQEGEIVVPVVEEELEISKRQRTTGGVRLHKTVHEREEIVDEPTVHEEVEVERVSVGRMVDGPVEVRQEGETTVYPVLEEVLVVEKRLMLKEEIRVTKRRSETREPQRVTLRREEVTVEELEGEAPLTTDPTTERTRR